MCVCVYIELSLWPRRVTDGRPSSWHSWVRGCCWWRRGTRSRGTTCCTSGRAPFMTSAAWAPRSSTASSAPDPSIISVSLSLSVCDCVCVCACVCVCVCACGCWTGLPAVLTCPQIGNREQNVTTKTPVPLHTLRLVCRKNGTKLHLKLGMHRYQYRYRCRYFVKILVLVLVFELPIPSTDTTPD